MSRHKHAPWVDKFFSNQPACDLCGQTIIRMNGESKRSRAKHRATENGAHIIRPRTQNKMKMPTPIEKLGLCIVICLTCKRKYDREADLRIPLDERHRRSGRYPFAEDGQDSSPKTAPEREGDSSLRPVSGTYPSSLVGAHRAGSLQEASESEGS